MGSPRITRGNLFGDFQSISGTRIKYLPLRLLLPKFVSEVAAMYHELQKQGTRTDATPCHTAMQRRRQSEQVEQRCLVGMGRNCDPPCPGFAQRNRDLIRQTIMRKAEQGVNGAGPGCKA
jgi:hypothetical protein